MALLGSPCSSQVKGTMSRVKGSLSRGPFIHLNHSRFLRGIQQRNEEVKEKEGYTQRKHIM